MFGFKPKKAKENENPNSQEKSDKVKKLGDGLAGQAGKAIKGRKKSIDDKLNAAMGYADGGLIKNRPDERPREQSQHPRENQDLAVLGTGAARKAGQAMKSRTSNIDNRLNAAMGYANGGLIQGEGTGISDDIPAEIPTGGFVMPADSTEQITPELLAQMGQKQQANVSDGEYLLPPEQIYQLGLNVLESMKDGTHVPAQIQELQQQGQGFNPNKEAGQVPSYADGGLIDEEVRRNNQYRVKAETKTQDARMDQQWQERSAREEQQRRANQNAGQEQPKPEQPKPAASRRQNFSTKARVPVALAGMAAAADGFNTPTEAYRERFGGMLTPTKDDSNLTHLGKDIVTRGFGLASDLGNQMTLGAAGSLFRDKNETSLAAPSAVAGAGAGYYAGNKLTGGAKGLKANAVKYGLAGLGGMTGYMGGKIVSDEHNVERARQPQPQGGGAVEPQQSEQEALPQQYPQVEGAPITNYDEGRTFNGVPASTRAGGLARNFNMVDGVKSYDNQSLQGFDPNSINTLSAEAFVRPTTASSQAISDSLQAAAGRGDWDAVNNHYYNQTGQGLDKGYKPRTSPNFVSIGGRNKDKEQQRLIDIITKENTGNDPTKHIRGSQRRAAADALAAMQGNESREKIATQTNQTTRQVAEQQADDPAQQMMQGLYQEYMNAKTQEAKDFALGKINAAKGGSSGKAKDNYVVVKGGQTVGSDGIVTTQPDRLFDVASRGFVGGGQEQGGNPNQAVEDVINDPSKSFADAGAVLRARGETKESLKKKGMSDENIKKLGF